MDIYGFSYNTVYNKLYTYHQWSDVVYLGRFVQVNAGLDFLHG